MPSFDIVSEVDKQELDNALNQARKELATRFDFKGTVAEIVHEKDKITLTAEDAARLRGLREIVIGKVLPYLAISIVLILFIILLTAWYFQVQFHNPAALALICFLFLLCSLGMGLLISAISLLTAASRPSRRSRISV